MQTQFVYNNKRSQSSFDGAEFSNKQLLDDDFINMAGKKTIYDYKNFSGSEKKSNTIGDWVQENFGKDSDGTAKQTITNIADIGTKVIKNTKNGTTDTTSTNNNNKGGGSTNQNNNNGSNSTDKTIFGVHPLTFGIIVIPTLIVGFFGVRYLIKHNAKVKVKP